jgi:Fic family protein
MVSTRIKKIKGKSYTYAEYSFRLPNGKIKKLSKYLADKNDVDSKIVSNYFKDEEEKSKVTYAISKYKVDPILTEKEITKLEIIKFNYGRMIKKLSDAQIKDILDRFTINSTYETNAIEGNSLTLKDVTLILTENLVPNNKNLREIYETRNTREAHRLLFDNEIEITRNGILKLHSILIKDTGVATGFKKIPNFLIMRDVKTTSPEDIEKEISALIKWYDENKDKEHPLRLATHFHAVFEKIHPFDDGNGRTGRILLNAILLAARFPPIIIRKTMRIAYFLALEAYDKGYKSKLVRFNLEKLKGTYEKFFSIYMKYI